MSTKNQNQLSANSKRLRKFRITQDLKTFYYLGISLVAVGVGVWVFFYLRSPDLFISKVSNPKSDNITAGTTEQNAATPDVSIPGAPDINSDLQNNPQNSNNPAPSQNQRSSSQSPQNTPAPAPSTSSTMPSGVISTLDSIETHGIKNNPYVAMDTSSVPDGTTVKFNRSTWQSQGESGWISGTINIMGKPYNGSLILGVTNGKWMVTGYSMD